MKKQIIYKKIDEIIPYENNARINDDAVKPLIESIKEFGFNNPIIIDENNVIINGHTRLKALQAMDWVEAPCIQLTNLSPTQKNAYRLADNKVAEIAIWDDEKLLQEIQGIDEIDLTLFGFEDIEKEMQEFEEEVIEMIEEDEGYYGDERENTFNAYNLHEYNPLNIDGKYNMPIIHKSTYIPNRLVGFNYVLNSAEDDSTIHFYLDDYQFERIWNRPLFYIEKLKRFNAVLAPDFSLYMDMPMAMKIWNVYRSRLIGQIMQDEGIEVIPTVSWAEKETFDFCFDGLEQYGTISVSTIGVKRDSEAYRIWVDGMDECIERLRPTTVIVYGGKLEDYTFNENVNVIYLENEVTKRWKQREE